MRRISILPRRKGNLLNLLREIGPMDTLLAAHALSIGATVVTGNMREFARVPAYVASRAAVGEKHDAGAFFALEGLRGYRV
jgi:predicted nucleic acid-binding protein